MKHELQTPAAWVVPLGDYLAWLRASQRPDSTIYLRSYQLRRFAGEIGVDPFAVTLDVLVHYLASKHHVWGRNTLRGMRNALRGFYGWAHHVGRMQHNPAALTPPAPAKAGYARPLEQWQIDFGLAGASAREKLMLKLGYRMGLRCVEMSTAHTSRVHASLLGPMLRVVGKGGKERNVPIPPDVWALVQHLEPGWFFPGDKDGHLSSSYISKLISRVLPEGCTAHMLRHTAGTRVLKAAGGNLRVAQEFLGHASSVTTDIYTKVESVEVHDAVLLAARAA
jgi:site-specific recombinase XerD